MSVFGQGAVGSRAVVNMAPVWGRANKHPDTDSHTGYRQNTLYISPYLPLSIYTFDILISEIKESLRRTDC